MVVNEGVRTAGQKKMTEGVANNDDRRTSDYHRWELIDCVTDV